MQLVVSNLKTVLFFSVLFGLSFCARVAAQANYRDASVCEILAHPKNSNLQYVGVDAKMIIAWPHGIVLVDKRCPGKGLLLDFPSTGADESVANLDKSIMHGSFPFESTGRFCGKIQHDAATKRLVLSLRSVLNLQPPVSTTAPDAPISNTLLQELGHADPPSQH